MWKLLTLFWMLIATSSFAQLVWEKVNLPPEYPVVFTSSRNIVYIANGWKTNTIYRSFDDGSSWDSILTPFLSPYSKPIVAVDSFGFIYGQTGDSLWVSSDDGETWELRKRLSRLGQFLLASRDSLYLFSYGGGSPFVFASSDQGITWSEFRTQSNGADINWAGAQISPGGHAFGFMQFDGSVRLMGGGDSAPKYIKTKFSQFSILDNDPISWMMFDQDGFGYGDHNGMLIRSSDEGLSWMAIDSNNSEYRKRYWGPYGVLKGGGIIAVSDTETVVSYDQTDTWSGIGEGVPTGYWQRFATTPRGTIFIETDSGLFRTSHFAAVQRSRQSATMIAFDPVSKVLTLNDIESNSRLMITDIMGRVTVQEVLRDPKESRIDLSGLGSGTYMAVVISENGTKSTMLSIYR